MGQTENRSQSGFDALFTGWRGTAIGLFAIVGVLLSLQSNTERLREFGIFGAGANGTLGYASDRIVGQPGWERVTAMTPGGAAAKAGLAPGTRIRFEHLQEATVDLAAGRAVNVFALSVGDERSTAAHKVTLVAQPRYFNELPLQEQVDEIIYSTGKWLALALGVLVLVRGWGSLTALTLGLGLMGYSHENVIPIWVTQPVTTILLQGANHLIGFSGLGLLLLPAALYAERVGRPSRCWTIALGAIGILWAGMILLRLWCDMLDASYPVVGDGAALFWLLLFALNFQGIYWSWRGRRDASGADRARFGTILVATIAQIFNGLFFVTAGLLDIPGNQTNGIVIRVCLLLVVNLLIPLSLAYAVLRHRVIDLGFAINRTIVYGSVSAILLASFGLIEWGIEHLLPEEWIKASAWIDAGAAVMVYLAFHRVHDAVENRVEDVFFRKWRHNEEALRRFVATATHFDDEVTLASAFADELSRFAGEGPVALYRRDASSRDNAFIRVAGSWGNSPLNLPRDDAAYALMRAENRPLDMSETRSDIPGVLALPMLDHGALAGLVLMDLKAGGALFRPDEIAVLGRAAHDVGLALAALRAGSVEAESRDLKIENRVLKEQMAGRGNVTGASLKQAEA
ncbi:hypothetical protein QH494_23640 [Sphingomonas sp. AR_OL41]|uniref:hypothetical protein n=1 Tax=Sphingomonas sp. AR_OL41 TaxID=3042729 RepID=UPI0024811609|nr:hypothetical protein [Sphingomonas sp. AR_OL41]MDH7975188.1 hypothetical protein [Sphingomonas sp. AR_OL41]